jgi:protein O-GlcNAc transferase
MQHPSVDSLRDEAYRRYQAGDLATAEQLCRQLLQQGPPMPDAVYLLGIIALDVGRTQQAMELFQKTAQLAPDNAVFVNALGEISMTLNKKTEALACFQQALALRPTYERGHNNLGRLQHSSGNLSDAQKSFAEAVRLNPRYAIAHNNLGAVLQAQTQYESAAACFRQALSLKPDYPEAHFNLGTILQTQGDPAGAAGQFQRAIELRPTYAKAYFQLAQVQELLRQDYAALASYQEAARLQPDDAEIQQQLGNLLILKGDWGPALEALERSLAIQPDRSEAFARLCSARQMVCDWRNYDAEGERLWADAAGTLAAGQVPCATPFQALTLPWSLERQFMIARSHCDVMVRRNRERGITLRHPHPERIQPDRIRIGYLSGDFYDHPISHLIQGLFGCHDRSRFEVFAYGFGKADDSVYRQRIVNGCEHFVDVSSLSIPALAERIAADGVHILIDLMGHTGINRMAALALRPAPIQVNFLGMLGTIGADFIDYMITDTTVTPPEFAPYFVEKFATMPHSYLIAEPDPVVVNQKVDRTRYRLPQTGFVFCSFNSAYKIEPQMFRVWMNILNEVPGSVLWLHSTGLNFESNLRREAQSCGVSPERLVFAGWMPRPEHKIRHRAADLFLDTLLYNAAATASLSLLMGLPFISCLGNTFGSRIGASLLKTVDLPELIATDLDHYQRLAVRLANHPDELQSYRDRLDENRLTSPLFDTLRFVRNLERAFRSMWDNYVAGNPPTAFAVSETQPLRPCGPGGGG